MASQTRKTTKRPARRAGSRRRAAPRREPTRGFRFITAPLGWITAPARFGLALSIAATSVLYVALRDRARA